MMTTIMNQNLNLNDDNKSKIFIDQGLKIILMNKLANIESSKLSFQYL